MYYVAVQFSILFFFFNDTATTEIYTLSLHDALPICNASGWMTHVVEPAGPATMLSLDRKSTRLNSSHLGISYAVFCLKKKQHHSSETNAEKIRLPTAPITTAHNNN